MDLGFGLITCERYPGDPRSDQDLYRDALELAAEAERLGFDSVWVSEHHFVDDAYLPSLLPMCAALAARTSRMAIGTSLLLAPLYEPVRLAEDAAVVDLISAGRLVLGLGLGWRREEFEAFGVSLSERGPRMEETVAILRQAWGGRLVTGGELVRYPGVAVTPKPARPGGPPVWIGASSETAVRRAGRIADGFLGTEVTPEEYGKQAMWIREEREQAGREADPFTFGLYMSTFAWPGDDAWDLVRDHHNYVMWKYVDMEEARGSVGPPTKPPPPGPGEEESLRRTILVGRPDEVAERILAYREAAGEDLTFVARLYWPGMDSSLQREVMAIFAEEVVPVLR